MTQEELLQMILLELDDMNSTVSLQLGEIAVRQDALGGYVHLVAAGIGVIVMLLTWIAVFAARR